MSGFFSDDAVKNPSADEPWKKSDRDYVLDTYLAGGSGAHPNSIAQKIGRNPKAVKRLVEQFVYNERDRVLRYEPRRRTSRKGKKLTQNEIVLLREHRERKVDVNATAKLLCRDVDELSGETSTQLAEVRGLKVFAPTLDLIWAHRYIYFVYKKPVITDRAYDQLVQEEIEYGGGGPGFEKIKVFKGWPKYIISLALYLFDKGKK